MAVFESLMQMMIEAGASYVFIWLLFAAIIYGALMKYELIGDSSAVAGVSLGGSFFLLLGIYAFAPAGIFLNFAAALGFAVFALLGLAIVLSMAGVNIAEMGEGLENPAALGGGIIILVAFIGALAYNLNWGNLLGDVGNAWQEVWFPILFLLFLLLIIAPAVDDG